MPAQEYVTGIGGAIVFNVKLQLMKDVKWYLVFSKPKCEKKVKDALFKHGIENYRPLITCSAQINGQIKKYTKPLFDQYIFVHITATEKSIVQKVDGIQNFIFWLGKPVTVSSEDISIIKNFTTVHEDVQIEKIEVIADDSDLSACKQLYYNIENLSAEKNKFVKVLLPTIGYAMVAEVGKSNVEVINISRSKSQRNRLFNSSFR